MADAIPDSGSEKMEDRRSPVEKVGLIPDSGPSPKVDDGEEASNPIPKTGEDSALPEASNPKEDSAIPKDSSTLPEDIALSKEEKPIPEASNPIGDKSIPKDTSRLPEISNPIPKEDKLPEIPIPKVSNPKEVMPIPKRRNSKEERPIPKENKSIPEASTPKEDNTELDELFDLSSIESLSPEVIPRSLKPKHDVAASSKKVPCFPNKRDIEKTIEVFLFTVKQLWNQPLTARSHIQRKHKNIIQDVIRLFMLGCREKTADETYMHMLTHAKFTQNKVYREYMNFNMNELPDLLKKVPTVDHVTTIGTYILFFVFYILFTEFEKWDVNSVTRIIHHKQLLQRDLLNKLYVVHLKYKCTFMFIGIPGYLFDDKNINEFLLWGKGLFSVNMLTAYEAFLKYLDNNPTKVANPKVRISYLHLSWEFTESVPEFIFEGLCFKAHDRIDTFGAEHGKIIFHSYKQHQYIFYPLPATKKSFNNGIRLAEPRHGEGLLAIQIGDKDDATNLVSPYGNKSYITNPTASIKKKITFKAATDSQINFSAFRKICDLGSDEERENPGKDAESPEKPIKDDPRGDLGPLVYSVKLKGLETRIEHLEREFKTITSSCSTVLEAIDRLEGHADTLRVAMIRLAKKIDKQTGYHVDTYIE